MESKEIKSSTKEWTKKLLSGDEVLVQKTISELREKGNSELIPVLGTLLHSNPPEEISLSVINFLRDLKNQDSVPALVEIIKKSKNLELFPQIISTAWENGLDYSEHIEYFINVVTDENLATAIEAFTVVEENIEKLSIQKRSIYSKAVLEKSKSVSKEKAKLLQELHSILSIASGPFKLDTEE
ncbi:MAG: hypothetical protein K9H12_12065 [Bacteroidales bacterium]|nr:hypothetical protein [Bacteroidales bacterium]